MYSNTYIKQLQSLHSDKKRPQGFGGKIKKLGQFTEFMTKWRPSTLLDYGCGKGEILKHLQDTYTETKISGYDPAVSMFNETPQETFDVVFSNDVLEHIEPEFVIDVLKHIDQLSTKYIWLRIDTLPARKTLPDGRNAHLIQKDKSWWLSKIDTSINGDVVYVHLTSKGKLDIAIQKNDTRRSISI